MGKRKVGALEKVEADLSNLQHKIKCDPKSYEADFLSQYHQYHSHLEIFLTAPSSTSDAGLLSLRDLIDFVSHVADCFPEVTKEFPSDLTELLSEHHEVLEPELRDKLVGALGILRKKGLIDSVSLLQTLFPILVSTKSKSLRALLFQRILSDLRNSNSKATNHKLNRTIQTVLYNLLTSDRTSSKGLWAVKITRELWKRQIWTDSKAVDIMKEAALADNEKVIGGAVRFFLGGDKEREEAEEDNSDDEVINIVKLKHQIGFNKKSRKKSRAVENATAAVKRKERKRKQPHPLNFSAFHLLNDPQGFAEELFTKHLQSPRSKLNLEQKLQVLQLVSRLIGLHRLTLISLYSYFLKYLTPRQPSVTSFLASLAQATHNLVPPDVLEPLVQKIANEFVSEASASEVASAGLNAIREVCVRQPLAMNDTLLQDLVMYRKSKDKGVMMAAKGLLGLYRVVGAEKLRKRDRGKKATIDINSGDRNEVRFGEETIGEIEGLELLEKWREEEKRRKKSEKGLASDASDNDEDDEDDEAWKAWEIDTDGSSDSGGWIDVSSEGEIQISDSEDEDSQSKALPNKKIKLAIPSHNGTEQEEMNNVALSHSNPEMDVNPKSSLATTRILTPADLAKLQELRTTSAVTSLLPGHRRHHPGPDSSSHSTRHPDDPLTAEHISGLAALSAGKQSREAKIAHARDGREDREYKGREAKKKERKEEAGKSTTNKDKARRKNFLMTMGKRRKKGKESLVEMRKKLRVGAKQQRGKLGGKGMKR